MRKNRPLVGSVLTPRPGVWKHEQLGWALWDDYAAGLPFPLLAERLVDFADAPVARLLALARDMPCKEQARKYLGSFEHAIINAREDAGAWYQTPPCIAQLPPILSVVDNAQAEVIHRAVLYRIALATLIVDDAAEDDRDRYAGQLFVDTHLDWLAATLRYDERDDRFWLGEGHLSSVYPLPNRVRCAEEMPNLASPLLQADLLMEASKTKQAATCN